MQHTLPGIYLITTQLQKGEDWKESKICTFLRPAFHVHVSARISASRKVVLVHFSVTISVNAFPHAGKAPMRGNAARWATFPRACWTYRCNKHALGLELVKTMKMPSDDEAWFRRRVFACMERDICFGGDALKRASGRNTYMESRPKMGFASIVCERGLFGAILLTIYSKVMLVAEVDGVSWMMHERVPVSPTPSTALFIHSRTHPGGWLSTYAFPLACFSAHFRQRKNLYPCTWKRASGITEFAWSLLGIFIVFTSSRLSATRPWKSRSSSGVSAHGYFTCGRKRIHGNGDREMHQNDFSARGNAHGNTHMEAGLAFKKNAQLCILSAFQDFYLTWCIACSESSLLHNTTVLVNVYM